MYSGVVRRLGNQTTCKTHLFPRKERENQRKRERERENECGEGEGGRDAREKNAGARMTRRLKDSKRQGDGRKGLSNNKSTADVADCAAEK